MKYYDIERLKDFNEECMGRCVRTQRQIERGI